MIQIENKCALQWLKEQPDYSADLIYCDCPYALGSEIIIKPDGKPDYKKAVDFMAKWEMPDGAFWEQFYKEANRVLKHGGHLLMFGIDRQLFLFGYYSNLAGFETKQSLYWYFISNFPKASDLSKMIDKNAGAEREVLSQRKVSISNNTFNSSKEIEKGFSVSAITTPTTDLAKKYDGFKYSIAPLKQVVETIMVFQKPYKTGSCLHDVLAYENGDTECTVGALDIEKNRVGFESEQDKKESTAKNQHKKFGTKPMENNNVYGDFSMLEQKDYNPTGRFPSQAFVTTETAEILDKQSGVLSRKDQSNLRKKGIVTGKETIYKSGHKPIDTTNYSDTGGASKILQKCDFETADFDLFIYEPKVSSSERNAGCENFETKKADLRDDVGAGIYKDMNAPAKNSHPTLKPIALNYQITKLFKTPNEQTVLVPFSGAGSELIGLFKAGFENIKGCELNPEYVEISKARVKHHCEDLFNQNVLIE
jgi:site-specific DNA-methyltransferase (adenine-specific)